MNRDLDLQSGIDHKLATASTTKNLKSKHFDLHGTVDSAIYEQVKHSINEFKERKLKWSPLKDNGKPWTKYPEAKLGENHNPISMEETIDVNTMNNFKQEETETKKMKFIVEERKTASKKSSRSEVWRVQEKNLKQ